MVKITHLGDVRNPTSVVRLCALRSRWRGISAYSLAAPGIKGGVANRKGGERWILSEEDVVVDVVVVVGAVDAVAA
jgi:hypothetical protein